MVAIAKREANADAELFGFIDPPAFFPPARCSVLREVGRGGMAIVYEAIDRHRERVALKMSRPLLPESDLTRFGQEAAIVRRLQHPGVPKIREHGCFAGGAWLTMEYVDGTPLEQLMANPGFSATERL